MAPLTLTYALADQDFARTRSLGIYNLSVQLFRHMTARPECGALTLLANTSQSWPDPFPTQVRVEMHDEAIGGRLGRIAWDQWGAYRAAARAGHDWLFMPKGFASFSRRCPVRLATMVADTMQYHYRENYPKGLPALESLYFRRALQATVRQSRVIFALSEFTKTCVERVARAEGLAVPPIVVSGVGFDDARPMAVAKEDRIVLLSSRWPHKRTAQTVDYLERWRLESRYAGSIHAIGGVPEGMVKPVGDAWQWHARLPPGEFERLVGGAAALIYSTDFEGFGMPPVEAILAGVCPVYSDIPTTREVMAGCGCPFDNASFESFGQALGRALETTAAEIESWRGALLERHHWNQVVARVITGLLDNQDP